MKTRAEIFAICASWLIVTAGLSIFVIKKNRESVATENYQGITTPNGYSFKISTVTHMINTSSGIKTITVMEYR